MLYRGSKLEQPVPTNTSLWSWIFSQAFPNCEFNKGRIAGFRDGETQEFLSFTAMRSQATYLSTAIAVRFGIGLGSHISVFCRNSILYPAVNFSAIRLGAIVTCSSPEYGVEEVVHILRTSESDLAYTDIGSWDIVCQAAEIVGLSRDRIVFVEEAAMCKRYNDRVSIHDLIREAKMKGETGQVRAWSPSKNQSNGDVPAYCSFTSGTTSLPKAVMISHHNVIAQIMQMRSSTAPDCPKVMLGVLPLYHITGIVQILNLPLALNQEVVLMSRFNMQEMLKAIVKYRSDELWLVPPILIRLVNDPMAAEYRLESVKQFNTGAAPLATEIIGKLADRFPHIRLRQAWGMTESCSALTVTPPVDQTYANAHTVGKVVPETIIKIIDPDYAGEGERLLGPGQSGEVLAKGPQVTMGYYKRPEATAETYDVNGFLHTGDVGFMNEAGFLIIHDRLKEMIKVNGVGLAPAELEDLLLGHHLVADAAVIGVPDDYAGEVPKAFVVLIDSIAESREVSEILLDFVKQRRSRHKWLAGGVEFVKAIPQSASGKILRKKLREQEKQRMKEKRISKGHKL